jgi:carbon-monoxide dehydrogenase medium subunit
LPVDIITLLQGCCSKPRFDKFCRRLIAALPQEDKRVKAPPFQYVKPQSLAEVFELLGEHGDDAQILAGGQSLMPTLHLRLSSPTVLIDINGLDELAGISIDDGQVTIGALTRLAEVLKSDIVNAHLATLSRAMPHVAHVAIRNRGTFGGSIAYADPAAELPACMLALDATLIVQSGQAKREIAASEFFLGLYETARTPGELLIGARIPIDPPNRVNSFLELSRRHGDFAVVGLAATANAVGDRLEDVRLAFFGCEDRAKLAGRAALAVSGKRADAPTIDAAIDALTEDLDPVANLLGNSATKRHLAAVLTRRALGELARGVGEATHA